MILVQEMNGVECYRLNQFEAAIGVTGVGEVAYIRLPCDGFESHNLEFLKAVTKGVAMRYGRTGTKKSRNNHR